MAYEEEKELNIYQEQVEYSANIYGLSNYGGIQGWLSVWTFANWPLQKKVKVFWGKKKINTTTAKY